MRVKEGFTLKALGAQPIVVATGDAAKEFSGIVRLYGAGAFLWEQMAARDCTQDDLVDALVEHYGIDRDTAAADVEKFVALAVEKGLVEA